MIGAVYAFLGIGLVLVYRTARILNLAHGESFAITGAAAAMLVKAGVPLAAAENPYPAALLGVNVERARLTAYGIGALLGALAGVLLIPLTAVDFQSGLAMTLRGFIAAAISGMSPIGVVLSGLGLGLFESM